MEIIKLDFPNVTPQRRRGKTMRRPATVELRWPNALGDEPEDALGKHIALDAGPDRGEYSVEAIQGGKLILRPFP